ncbi:outer membrane beta-barrel protein, partial [uncultured Muribaculum sp.]
MSYKRTLSDIPYTAISSVINWSDAYNYTVGNPDLKAQSADIVMAGLSLLRNKINITALYAVSHDRIYWQ